MKGVKKAAATPANTPALAALAHTSLNYRVHTYENESEHYGQEAAQVMVDRLGIEAEQIFKTLIIELSGTPAPGESPLAVAIVPVTTTLTLKRAAMALGAHKAHMAAVDLAERTTGYVAGGISPLGQKRALRTVIDESALLWDSIFVSGGRRGCDLEIAPADLITLTNATVADIAAQ